SHDQQRQEHVEAGKAKTGQKRWPRIGRRCPNFDRDAKCQQHEPHAAEQSHHPIVRPVVRQGNRAHGSIRTYLMPENACIRCRNGLAPKMTNMAGSMNNTIGIVSLTPNLCALSSSLIRLSRRSSSAILRRAWLNGVPYCRLWLIMVPNRRSPSDVDANFSNASRRFGNTRRSSRRPYKTRAMAGLE